MTKQETRPNLGPIGIHFHWLKLDTHVLYYYTKFIVCLLDLA